MKVSCWIALSVLVLSVGACSHSKPKPLVPLELAYGAKAETIALNGQATQAFLTGQMAEAKNLFAQVVAAAPDSGQAHYN